jgi:tetratricopeptide (TPR) repeat protein
MLKWRIGFVLLLTIFVSCLYVNIIYNNPTDWDDPVLVNNEQNYVPTSDNLQRILTIKSSSTFQPIRDFSYMIDKTMFPDNFFLGIHLHSIFLYILMMLATFLFLMELFKAFLINENKAFIWAYVATVIYAVHPVHVESVAWLYARKEPLLGLFTMLSLWAFVKARTGKARYYIASTVFLILAVLSKPTAAVIPAAILAIDISLQAHKPERSYWLKRGIFFAAVFSVVVPFSYWLINMLHNAGGIKLYHGGSFFNNLFAASQIFIEYISLYGFTVYYAADYPVNLYAGPAMWQAWVFVALNVLLICSAIFFFIRKKYLIPIFIAWHYIFVLPVSHIIPINQNLTDRYALLPSLSWCVLLGYIITWLWYKRLNTKLLSENFPRLVATAIFLVMVSAYSLMTLRQTFAWRNSLILWENTYARFPDSHVANAKLAPIYIQLGRYEEAKTMAIQALKLLPYDYYSLSNLALIQLLEKEYGHALHNFNIALELKPELATPKIGIATCYFETGDYINAYEKYKVAFLSTDYTSHLAGPLIFSRFALSAFKLGKIAEANTYLEKAVKIAGKSSSDLKDMALIANSMGNEKISRELFDKISKNKLPPVTGKN